MTDLRIDLHAMRAVGADLTAIAAEFQDTNVRSDRITDAAGHDGLADAIRSFAHKWDDTREDMLENVRGMSEAAVAVADVFEETDSSLARALTDPPTPARPGVNAL